MLSVVKIENLKKSYGNKTVLNKISFEIEQGQIIAVIGPNGTGKTTLMEIMMSLRKFDEGNVEILNVPLPQKLDYVRSRIGVILQEGGMYNYIKLKEALDLFASFYQIEKSKIQDLIDEFELTPYLNTKFHKLSGGWKQRALLAIAFIHDPALIFLDEPTTGLDPKAARILWEKIKGTKEDNRTIILTTHSMEEVENYCDSVIILKDGSIVASGAPEDLKEQLGKKYFSDVYFHYIEGAESHA